MINVKIRSGDDPTDFCSASKNSFTIMSPVIDQPSGNKISIFGKNRASISDNQMAR